MDRNVFSHKEHIGHKEGSSFAEATEDKTGNGGGGKVEEWRSGMVEWLGAWGMASARHRDNK